MPDEWRRLAMSPAMYFAPSSATIDILHLNSFENRVPADETADLKSALKDTALWCNTPDHKGPGRRSLFRDPILAIPSPSYPAILKNR